MNILKITDRCKATLPTLLIAFATVVAVVSSLQCAPSYTCTFDDINGSTKVQQWVMEDIQRKGIKLSDEMEIVLYFDHYVNSSEIAQMEEIVVEFREDSAYPTGWEPIWLYSARCVVQDICRLIDMELVQQIGSGEGETSIP